MSTARSRSDGSMVAVGFNPRSTDCANPFRRVATIEAGRGSLLEIVRRGEQFRRRYATQEHLGWDAHRGLKPTATLTGRYATDIHQSPEVAL